HMHVTVECSDGVDTGADDTEADCVAIGDEGAEHPCLITALPADAGQEVDVENRGSSTAQLPVDHAARITCSVRHDQVGGTMPRSRIRWISPSRSSDMRTESMCAPTPAASSST